MLERLQDFEAPPPPGVGGAILDQVNGGSGNSPWLISLVLLLGVFLLGTGYYVITDKDGIDRLPSTTNRLVEASTNSTSVIEQAILVGLPQNSTVIKATSNTSGLAVENVTGTISREAEGFKGLF